MKRFLAILTILLAMSAFASADPAKKQKATKASKAKAESAETAPFVAPPSKFGLGIFLGQPSGISFGMDLSRTNWLDFKAAWDFSGGGNSGFAMLFQGNYQYALPGVFVVQRNDIVPFFGLGAELAVNSGGVKLGARVPFGLNYRFVKIPLELSLEIGLGMYLFPRTEFNWSSGLGVRYRFW